MIIGVVKESYPGERRVALTPDVLTGLTKKGLEIHIENGAGLSAGFTDQAYQDKNAKLASRTEVFSKADILIQVRCPGSNPVHGSADLRLMRSGQAVIGLCDPLWVPNSVAELAKQQVAAFSMELMPRITRAQNMDVLSSQANIAGYKAVLLAAEFLPKVFPMMTTAAGTIKAAKVFVIGAGVAGLQALATAKRLGAITSGYDVRAAVKDQVQSVGAKFVELPLETAEGAGGYAKAMDEEFYRKQRELMAKVIAEHDVVITTAAIPGKKSPILVTTDMVKGMPQGSVIVDLAAERGGNCELTKADQTVIEHGVTILGPSNLPASVPFHASQMYAKNVVNFLNLLIKDGQLSLNLEDEVIRETLLTRDGQVIHAKVKELLK